MFTGYQTICEVFDTHCLIIILIGKSNFPRWNWPSQSTNWSLVIGRKTYCLAPGPQQTINDPQFLVALNVCSVKTTFSPGHWAKVFFWRSRSINSGRNSNRLGLIYAKVTHHLCSKLSDLHHYFSLMPQVHHLSFMTLLYVISLLSPQPCSGTLAVLY